MSEKSKKTKKQHYVPRCYLEAWAIPSTYQVHVYDRALDKTRISSIYDVASENYFYDVVPSVLSKQLIDLLSKQGTPLDSNLPSQEIEHILASKVEGPFSNQLKGLISKSQSATPWIINNCYFISEENKKEISEFLSIQFIRTKQVRNGIVEISNCLSQALKDMGASSNMIGKYCVSKGEAKNVHTEMLMDGKNLSDIANSFQNLTWILGVNKTRKRFYTSDSPIGKYVHGHPSGLKSKGAEIFFPISPTCILIMFDGGYYNISQLERKYVLIDNEAEIDYYNSLCALQCERCVFSADGNFSSIEQIKKNAPDAFFLPHTRLTWGGKSYLPTT